MMTPEQKAQIRANTAAELAAAQVNYLAARFGANFVFEACNLAIGMLDAVASYASQSGEVPDEVARVVAAATAAAAEFRRVAEQRVVLTGSRVTLVRG